MIALRILLGALFILGAIGVLYRVAVWTRRKDPRGDRDVPPPFGVNCRCVLEPTTATAPTDEAVRDIGLWIKRYGKAGHKLQPYQRAAIDGILSAQEVSLWRYASDVKVLGARDFATFFLGPLDAPTIWDPPRLAIDHWKRSWFGFGRRWRRIVPRVLVEYRAARDKC